MPKRKIKKEFPSELRMDLVSSDWVAIASARARRPETFAKHRRIKDVVSPKDCPFCQEEILEKSIAHINKPNGSWFVLSILNEFPALSAGEDLNERREGPNRIMNGLGYQEIIITADHQKQLGQFSKEEVKMVIDLYQERYLDLISRKFIKYVSIFHNHGWEAGGTIAHPHSQMIAIPVIDPDLRDSLDGAESFYRSQGKCVYCTMIDWDLRDGQRIVYENKKFVALCPFAPQVSFEVRIYPKEHQPYFEKITEEEKELFADAFHKAISKIYKGLKDPAYNFYFHTAPHDGGTYEHYHWHLNILPRTSIWAGFELGVGIEISTIEPEKAAAFLRKVK
jgi:UDPglucose--hexose-1-phosphate uridylyltransferase